MKGVTTMMNFTKSTFFTTNANEIGKTVEVKFFATNLAQVTITTTYLVGGDRVERFSCEAKNLRERLPEWALD